MKKALTVFALTLVFLAVMDLLVALALSEAGERQKLGSLVRYFEYGRSVPGKLARWQANPDLRGNLFDVSWRDALLAASTEEFRTEAPDIGPVIRSYGMSFTDNILHAATKQDSSLVWDRHSGPGAPPNFAYAMIEDDAPNRRAGDVVVFGILASSVPAMAALSNRSWAFEQPAPFTYPIYRPEGAGLSRIDPLITSEAAERALASDPGAANAWAGQMAREDAFYGPQTFGLTWLDPSPFMRLVRRSLAKGHISRTEAAILKDGLYPYETVLTRMIGAFAETARSRGQHPVVMLIQSQAGPDLLALVRPVLEREEIPYLATAEHADLRDSSVFLPDGHYRPEIDAAFGKAFRELLAELGT